MSPAPDILIWTPELAARQQPPPPPAYEAPIARFATAWAARLRQLTRLPVQVELEASVVTQFAAYQAEDPRERCFNVLRAEGPRCPGVLTFDAGLLGLLVQMFLGGGAGGGEERDAPRFPEGAVGWRIAKRLAGVAATELDLAFRPAHTLDLRCTRQESRLQWSGLMLDDEQILLSRFKLRSEGRSGRMELLWPLRAMREFLRHSEEGGGDVAASHAARGPAARSLTAALASATVELTAVLGEAEFSVATLASLQIGDVLTLDRSAGDPLLLRVEGQRKWSGQPGVARGHRALRLTGS